MSSQRTMKQADGEYSSQYEALLGKHQEISFARDAYRNCEYISDLEWLNNV